MKIALFSGDKCPQVAVLRAALEARQVRPLVFDMRIGGDAAPLMAAGTDSAQWQGHSLRDADCVYLRCKTPNTLPAPPPVLNVAAYCEYRRDYLREQEFSATTHAFLAQLAAGGTLVVNELRSYADHDTKAQFYERMRALGFPVPDTLSTNDPQRALEFVARYEQVVVKPAVGVGSTRIFRPEDRERISQFQFAPVLMQERVPGDTLRVNIVGDSVVLALRIVGSGETIDSRTAPRGFAMVVLPEEEQQRLVRANRALGLHYAAWDIIEGPGGRYAYLDCNPGPYILWTGAEFSRAVMDQLAAYLIGYAETRSVAEASARVRRYTDRIAG